MAKQNVSLTLARLKELLHYDPETGIFTWRQDRSTVKAGDVAGGLNAEGYRRIWIEGRFYQANALAWFYMTGERPPRYVGFVDLDKENLAFSNLRPSTLSQLKGNSRVYKNNKMGIKGVRQHRNGRYEARLRIDKKLQYLGCFKTVEEAKAVYNEAAKLAFGEFSRS